MLMMVQGWFDGVMVSDGWSIAPKKWPGNFRRSAQPVKKTGVSDQDAMK